MRRRLSCLAALGLVLALAGTDRAHAQVVTGQIWENTPASVDATVGADTSTNTGSATFTVNPAFGINYSSPPSGTSIADFLHLTSADFTTVDAGFNSSDPVTGPANESVGSYVLLTGSIYLSAGSHTFDVSHDDGAELSLSGGYGTLFSSPGPTVDQLSTATVNITTAGDYTFNLAYGENNGLPAVLDFTVDGTVVGVPEPSTLVMGGTAFLAVSGLTWRRNRKSKVALS